MVGGINKPGADNILMKRENIVKNTGWLSNSLVGIMRWEWIIPSISGICEACGIRGVKVARMGGLKVLLSFSNLEEATCI